MTFHSGLLLLPTVTLLGSKDEFLDMQFLLQFLILMSQIRAVEVEVEVNLRPTVRRLVCPGVRHPSGTSDQFFFLLEVSFRHLWVCYFAAPSLTRGRVCNLLYNCFWALPEKSLLGQLPQNSRPYFTLSSETPPTWRARSPYWYPPGTGWPSYTPWHWIPFLSPLTTRRATVEVF
jgi:hypothetical protein